MGYGTNEVFTTHAQKVIVHLRVIWRGTVVAPQKGSFIHSFGVFFKELNDSVKEGSLRTLKAYFRYIPMNPFGVP